jgi:hypothetical protein
MGISSLKIIMVGRPLHNYFLKSSDILLNYAQINDGNGIIYDTTKIITCQLNNFEGRRYSVDIVLCQA